MNFVSNCYSLILPVDHYWPTGGGCCGQIFQLLICEIGQRSCYESRDFVLNIMQSKCMYMFLI